MLADRPLEVRANIVDIPRKQTGKRRNQLLLAGAGVLVLVAITVGLSRLRAAAPTVERGSVWPDMVKRGAMLRQIKGPGQLVPEQIRWITADTAGRVERIPLRPGAPVTKGMILMELSNPDVMLQALDAERQLAQAQSDLLTLRNNLETQRLSAESSIASVTTEQLAAGRTADALKSLHDDKTISEIEWRQAKDKETETDARLSIERQRLHVATDIARQQLEAQRQQINRMRAVVAFRKQLVESMRVRSLDDGVLQELPLDIHRARHSTLCQ